MGCGGCCWRWRGWLVVLGRGSPQTQSSIQVWLWLKHLCYQSLYLPPILLLSMMVGGVGEVLWCCGGGTSGCTSDYSSCSSHPGWYWVGAQLGAHLVNFGTICTNGTIQAI